MANDNKCSEIQEKFDDGGIDLSSITSDLMTASILVAAASGIPFKKYMARAGVGLQLAASKTGSSKFGKLISGVASKVQGVKWLNSSSTLTNFAKNPDRFKTLFARMSKVQKSSTSLLTTLKKQALSIKRTSANKLLTVAIVGLTAYDWISSKLSSDVNEEEVQSDIDDVSADSDAVASLLNTMDRDQQMFSSPSNVSRVVSGIKDVIDFRDDLSVSKIEEAVKSFCIVLDNAQMLADDSVSKQALGRVVAAAGLAMILDIPYTVRGNLLLKENTCAAPDEIQAMHAASYMLMKQLIGESFCDVGDLRELMATDFIGGADLILDKKSDKAYDLRFR